MAADFKSTIDVESECKEFSATCTVLKVDSKAELVVPAETDIAAQHCSAEVLQSITKVKAAAPKCSLRQANVPEAISEVATGGEDSVLRLATLKDFQAKYSAISEPVQVQGASWMRLYEADGVLGILNCTGTEQTGKQICIGGLGISSVVPEAEADSYGEKLALPWSLSKATNCPSVLERVSSFNFCSNLLACQQAHS